MALSPSRLSSALRSISDRIDRSKMPSRSAVAAELRRVLAAMNGKSADDLKAMLVAQIHAYDIDDQEFVSAGMPDKVKAVEGVLRSHGVKAIDLTGREDLPVSDDVDAMKVAVDLHFIDGDKTVLVDPGQGDPSGIVAVVDGIFNAVYSALGDSGERLPPEISSPFEPDHHDISLARDGSSFQPEG